MPEADDDYRPSWLDYWNRPPNDFPEFNPNWRTAEHDHGVAFFAPWEEVFAGFPEHARRCAVALAATSIPLHLRSARGGMQFYSHKDLAASRAFAAMKDALEPLLTASVKNYDADIWQVVAEESAFFRLGGPKHPWMDAEQLALVHSRRVISTVFERDRISDDAVQCLNRVGQVWVATEYDRQMLGHAGVDRVRVVPIPYFPDDPHLALNERERQPGKPCTFYHIGKWEPRKEHRNIIGAFLLAFRPGEAKFYLKTSSKGPTLKSDYPESPALAVNAWLQDERVQANGWTHESVQQNLFIIQVRLTPQRMLQLHRGGDVYVTLSRGEGFDMPAFDAKLAGNLMVYTPSGGPQSFAGTEDVRVAPSGSVPCDPFYGWGDAHYLDYELDDAVRALREAKRKVDAGVRVRGMDPAPRFSAAAVGTLMRTYVEELRGEHPKRASA